MVQVAGGEVSGEAYGVGYAAPRFKTDEGTARLVWSPDAIGLGLIATDGEVGFLVLVQKGYALNRTMLQHEGVNSEGLASDGQEAVFIHRHGRRSGQFGEEAAVQAVAEHWLVDHVAVGVEALQVAVDGIILMVVRQQQCRVCANLEVDIFVVCVTGRPLCVEAIPFSVVMNRQLELVRILLQRATGQDVAIPYFLELRVPGKAVLAHGVLLAVYTEHVTVDFSHHGEQDGRATTPECGVTVPKVFAAVGLKGLQLGAVGGYSEI